MQGHQGRARAVKFTTSGACVRTCFIAFFAVFSILICASDATRAQPTFPKDATGYVWDSAGTPLEGAQITVNLKNNQFIKYTQTDTTDSAGEYYVSFAACEQGWTIEAIATYNSNQETNSTTADGSSLQWVNVTFPFEIPQFGNLVGFAGAAFFIGVVAVLFIKRKK